MLIQLLKHATRDTAISDLIHTLRGQRQIARWVQQGRPAKVPHLIKERVVKDYAHRFGLRVLVETGTFRGLMLTACRRNFDQLYSIELDEALHAQARQRFAHLPHVRLLQGDSGRVLPQVLDRIDQPALFWLDAHYSGGITARAAADTPIAQELAAVLLHPVPDHVVLIDDAHEFVGQNDYPTLAALEQFVQNTRPATLTVQDNIIRITPHTPRTTRPSPPNPLSHCDGRGGRG